MKDKTKKIIAGLGMGLVLGGGALGTTGCKMKLSDDQISKIMSVVDRSEKFMDETIDLLETSNAELDRKEVAKLYDYAVNRIVFNKDNIWDNIKLKFSQVYNEQLFEDENIENGEFNLFKKADGVSVVYSMLDGEIYLLADNDYSDDESNIPPEGDYPTLDQVTSYTYMVYDSFIPIVKLGTIEENDIVNYVRLENGNHYISAITMVDLSDLG